MAILKGVKDRIDIKITAQVEVDNDGIVSVPFVATYRKPKFSEAKEVLLRVHSEEVDDRELMDTYLLGWKGLQAEDGSEVEFTPENLTDVLESREYRKALASGLMSVLMGKDALIKNSSRLVGSGR